MKRVNCNELIFMTNAAGYLSKGYEQQYDEIEWYARWNLAEEIGLEWIDATGIIYSENLAQAISKESLELLKSILSNFERAFDDDSLKKCVWTSDAMVNHPFWDEQRCLAKRFLKSVSVL